MERTYSTRSKAAEAGEDDLGLPHLDEIPSHTLLLNCWRILNQDRKLYLGDFLDSIGGLIDGNPNLILALQIYHPLVLQFLEDADRGWHTGHVAG